MFTDRLENYYKSGHAALFVVSYEEHNITRDIASMVAKVSQDTGDDVSFSHWSIASGFGGDINNGDIHDPVEAIEFLTSRPAESALEKHVILLYDFHLMLEDKNPMLIRVLKEAVDMFKTQQVCLVMTGCRYDMPEELEKLVIRMDYDMPSDDDIRSILSSLMVGVPEDVEVPDEPKIEQIIAACKGMTSEEIENAIALSVVSERKVDPAMLAAEKANAIKSCGFLEVINVNKTLDDIGGMEGAKEWIGKRSRAYSEEAQAYGLPSPKGWLILGPPGTGKSLLSEIVASVLNVPLIRWDIGSCFGSLVGQSEQNVEHVFSVLKAFGRCVVWLDEVEKALSGSGSSSNTDGGTSARVFGKILTFMQENDGVFFSATANAVDQLPPELLRKGRFDEIMFVDLPNDKEREQIWNIHKNKHIKDHNIKTVTPFVKASEGFTGAEIEQAIIDGMYTAFDAGTKVTPAILLQSISDSVPVSKTMGDKITKLRTWAQDRCRMASGVSTKKKIVAKGKVNARSIS